MRNLLIIILALVTPGLAMSQSNLIKGGVYKWPTKKGTMLSGSAFDLSKIEVSANNLASGKQQKTQVPSNEEHLLLIKSGVLTITVKDSTYRLEKGSVVMIMPSDKYSVKNEGTESASYHLMKYRSKLPVDLERGKTNGGSFVRDWNKLTFIPQEKGGTRAYFNRPTAMARKFEIHVTTLKEGFISHPPHTHRAEEIILILEGNVEMLIGESSYKASSGDILFAPTQVLHGLKNDGKGICSYFAIQWE